MGLTLDDLYLIKKHAVGLPEGKATFLGVPDINFSKEAVELVLGTEPNFAAPSPRRGSTGVLAQKLLNFTDVEKILGIENSETLDFSNYENSSRTFDLNTDSFSEDEVETSSIVIDAGVLEHVFDVPNALNEVAKKLKKGGVVVHLNPGNGFYEHGFWQISPTLYRNFYQSAGWKIECMGFYKLPPRVGRLVDLQYLRTNSDLYRKQGGAKYASNIGRIGTFFIARKSSSHNPVRSVVQDYYSSAYVSELSAEEGESDVSNQLLEHVAIGWSRKYILIRLGQTISTLLGSGGVKV